MDRLTRARRALRVPKSELVDAICALSWRPVPPLPRAHATRALYEHVIHTVGVLPAGAVEPGDIAAATDVRVGIIDVRVPTRAEVAGHCIERTVDDLGIAEIAELARQAGLTWDDVLSGAIAVCEDGLRTMPVWPTRSGCGAPHADEVAAYELEARLLVDEIAARPPARWGRRHSQAVRTALYRCLADLADALLDVSESSPTPLEWRCEPERAGARAVIRFGAHVRTVVVGPDDEYAPVPEPVWPNEGNRPRHAWSWQVQLDPAVGAGSCGSGAFPTALAARHAAECAVTSIIAAAAPEH